MYNLCDYLTYQCVFFFFSNKVGSYDPRFDPKIHDPTKVNNNDKSRERVGQTSNNSLGSQCFGCQGQGCQNRDPTQDRGR